MPGERIVLTDDTDGNTARLVRVTARLAGVGLGPHALIGGLAVMCRLAAVHRATQDVDTVTEATTPSAVEVITSSIGAPDPTSPNRVLVDGVRVDVIDTEAFGYQDLEGIDHGDRLFIVSHRWALDTAGEASITVGQETAHIRVATPSALVAMKSGAVLSGRTRAPQKLASDLYDLYRLVLAHDRAGEIAHAFESAPFGLGPLVAQALRARVIEQPERAVRWLADGGPDMHAVRAVDLLDVLGPLVDRLHR